MLDRNPPAGVPVRGWNALRGCFLDELQDGPPGRIPSLSAAVPGVVPGGYPGGSAAVPGVTSRPELREAKKPKVDQGPILHQALQPAGCSSSASGLCHESHLPSCPRFPCPVCLGKAWATLPQLQNHIEKFHLCSNEIISEDFLHSYNRRVCQTCQLLVVATSVCRRCKAGPSVPKRGREDSEISVPMHEDCSVWEDLPTFPRGTLRFIPQGVVQPWAAALASEIEGFLADPSRLRALQLMRMPRIILAPCGRGGRRHNRQTNQVIEARLRMAGQKMAVLEEVKAASRKQRKPRLGRPGPVHEGHPEDHPPQQSLDEGSRRAVLRAVREGALAKATRLLLNSGKALGREAEADLRKLHPSSDLPTIPSTLPPDMADFEPGDIRKALRSFPPGSGAGPSGLMAAHLPLGPSGDEVRLLEVVSTLCSAIALGKLPAELRDVFCAARLIALPKKPSGVRPIAVGETFRRIAAKCLVQKYQSQAMEGLTPLQVGVGLPGAVDAVVFKVREWMRTAPTDHALLTLDFSNAYNTIDRSAMLAAIALKCPSFLHYAKFCYGAPTPLLADDFSISSSTGTQQGDACGPLFFSVTVHDAIVASNVPDTTWSHWYLDDGAQAGHLATLAAAMDVLEPRAAAVGLKLNRSKCKLWGPGNADSTPYPSLAGIPWVPWSTGLIVLGTPVGSAPFVRGQLAASTDKLSVALELLQCLGCPQSSSLILRACLGAAKVVHLLRSASYAESTVLASGVDSLLKSAWGVVRGVPLSEAK